MKQLPIILLFFLINLKSQSIENDKVYITHGNDQGVNYPYGVSELIIKADSTFSWKSFNVDKNNWKKYYKGDNIISISGNVIKENDLYILKEMGCNSRGPNKWIVKITEEKIEFYINKKSELTKTRTEYKRIKVSG
ncbi:hypothetical protein LRR18_01155 [Mangrovimonas sp. AS39]|uniref:hypothetical protein n=1 Tax=Mangrovimonas futianensis TaxID=2895523 RepID=UPI001E442DA9|nr:hypothetical protein [Mangrovimonas futianensis]MCF1190174.1 hypothetical protein [Mangrovimonas futianensis]MCF1194075.1 hypothetical protein [Mangrovimonas futianensis]MCF1421085.1 hypothetical protein [Mangrovimonas futianensis]